MADFVKLKGVVWQYEVLGAKFEYIDIPDDLKDISKGRDDFFEISFLNIFSFFLIIIYYIGIGYIGYGFLLLFTYFFEVNTTLNSYFLIVNECFNPISLCFFIQVLLMTFFIVLSPPQIILPSHFLEIF